MCKRILFVDDDPNLLQGLKRMLRNRRQEWDMIFCSYPEEVTGLLNKKRFDVVIMDVMMPKISGLKLLEEWQDRINDGEFEVVMMTGLDDTDLKRRALELGAIDLMNKPVQTENITARIENLLRMKSYRDSLKLRTEELNSVNKRLLEEIKVREGIEEKLLKLNEELVAKNELLEKLAIQDQLTGLHNRRFFDQKLSEYSKLCLRARQSLSCVMIDLDHFKNVNDTYGHLAGDYILRSVATVINGLIRTTDIFARYGGEEFVLLLPYTSLIDGLILTEKLRMAIEEAVFGFEGKEIRLTISLGISEINEDEANYEDLVSRADRALYCAKQSGRNQVCRQDDIL